MRTYIIFHATVSKLRRHDLQYLPSKPPFLCHCRVRVPIRGHLFQTTTLSCGDDDLGGLALTERASHGRRKEVREDVSELVARREFCERQLLARLELELVEVRQDELSFGKELQRTFGEYLVQGKEPT